MNTVGVQCCGFSISRKGWFVEKKNYFFSLTFRVNVNFLTLKFHTNVSFNSDVEEFSLKIPSCWISFEAKTNKQKKIVYSGKIAFWPCGDSVVSKKKDASRKLSYLSLSLVSIAVFRLNIEYHYIFIQILI